MILNFIIVGLYFLTVILIGYWSGKKETNQDFIIASRNVGLFRSSASMFAVLGGEVLIAQAALAYIFGIASMWFWVGLAIGTVLLGLASKKIKPIADKFSFLTIPEYFFLRWGKKNSYLAAAIIFIAFFSLLSIQFMAAGNLLAPFFGWSYSSVVIITGLVVLAYLLLGGYKSVINTDLIQAVLMIGITIFLAFTIKLGHFTPQELDFFSIGAFTIVSFLVLGISVMFASADVWQRIYSARNSDTAKKSLWLTAFLFLLFGAVLSFVGLAARNNFPNADPSEAFFLGLFQLVPPELLGFSVVVVLAAVMSTIDTEVFLLSSSIAKDFIGRTKEVSEEKLKKILKFGMIGLSLLAMLVAIFVSDVISLLFGLISFSLSLSPAVVGSLFWKLKPNAVFLSMVGGVLTFAGLIVFNQFTPENAVATLPGSFLFLIIGQLIFKSSESAAVS